MSAAETAADVLNDKENQQNATLEAEEDDDDDFHDAQLLTQPLPFPQPVKQENHNDGAQAEEQAQPQQQQEDEQEPPVAVKDPLKPPNPSCIRDLTNLVEYYAECMVETASKMVKVYNQEQQEGEDNIESLQKDLIDQWASLTFYYGLHPCNSIESGRLYARVRMSEFLKDVCCAEESLADWNRDQWSDLIGDLDDIREALIARDATKIYVQVEGEDDEEDEFVNAHHNKMCVKVNKRLNVTQKVFSIQAGVAPIRRQLEDQLAENRDDLDIDAEQVQLVGTYAAQADDEQVGLILVKLLGSPNKAGQYQLANREQVRHWIREQEKLFGLDFLRFERTPRMVQFLSDHVFGPNNRNNPHHRLPALTRCRYSAVADGGEDDGEEETTHEDGDAPAAEAAREDNSGAADSQQIHKRSDSGRQGKRIQKDGEADKDDAAAREDNSSAADSQQIHKRRDSGRKRKRIQKDGEADKRPRRRRSPERDDDDDESTAGGHDGSPRQNRRAAMGSHHDNDGWGSPNVSDGEDQASDDGGSAKPKAKDRGKDRRNDDGWGSPNGSDGDDDDDDSNSGGGKRRAQAGRRLVDKANHRVERLRRANKNLHNASRHGPDPIHNARRIAHAMREANRPAKSRRAQHQESDDGEESRRGGRARFKPTRRSPMRRKDDDDSSSDDEITMRVKSRKSGVQMNVGVSPNGSQRGSRKHRSNRDEPRLRRLQFDSDSDEESEEEDRTKLSELPQRRKNKSPAVAVKESDDEDEELPAKFRNIAPDKGRFTKDGRPIGRKRWTAVEKNAVKMGVKQFGKGEWTSIKVAYRKELRNRTGVQIKDCWRTMEKRGEVSEDEGDNDLEEDEPQGEE